MLRNADLGSTTGTVAAFDAPSGLGEIAGDDGQTYPFHCTAIADGTRDIAVGTTVTFTITAGHRGRFEATQITSSRTGSLTN